MIRWIFLFLCSFAIIYGNDFSHIKLSDPAKAGYLHIPRDRSIDTSTYLYVKYALEAFREDKVQFVLLDLNTPGGEVFAALQISEELKKMDREFSIPVIAFVDNWALSAGALLAYSCRYIGSVSDGSMGAAEPVTVSSDGKMETASEKMVSALKTEFAKVAELYGRNPIIAEAMVDRDIVVVQRQGKILELLNDEQIITKGKSPDTIIKPMGKLLTLDSKQMEAFGISSFTVPELTREGASFLPGEKLAQLPFFAEQKVDWISYENWKIDFFAFLSHPFVSSILMFGLLIGVYSAIQGNGLSASTLIGLVCLSLILVSAFATQVISWLEVALVLLGIGFFLIDLLFISGFGILGVFGIAFFLMGLTAMLLPPLKDVSFEPGTWGIAMDEWVYRLSLYLFVILVFFVVALPFGSRFLRKSPSFKRLVLQDTSNDEASFAREALPALGTKGLCFSALRPFGKVQIGDIYYEAQSEGELIATGRSVEVIGHKQNSLIVKEIEIES